jgi:hypothetical protein
MSAFLAALVPALAAVNTIGNPGVKPALPSLGAAGLRPSFK